MRRALSILLIVFFGLGPLEEALPTGEGSRLPPCCRRHGAHHCAMSSRIAAQMVQAASGKPIVTAPLTCPCFPGYTTAPASTINALAAPPVRLPVLAAQDRAPVPGRAAARLSQLRNGAGRGPPGTALS